jgi:group I intron endonuclease
METYGYIYITTNTINGKRYIGQHKSRNWDSNYIGSGKLLKQAIKKYGLEGFTCFPLIWGWSREELNQLEIEYIAHYKPEYNLAEGGQGGSTMLGRHHTKETRKKLSEAAKLKIGEKNPFYGKYHTEETNRKNSDAHKGRKPYIMTDEIRRRMSEARKRYYQNKRAA